MKEREEVKAMKKILVLESFNHIQKETLEKENPDFTFVYKEDQEWENHLDEYEAIIGLVPQDLKPQLKSLQNLKLLQLSSAGFEGWPELVNCSLCNASGTFGLSISEHLIATIIMMYRKLPQVLENQKNHIWKHDMGMFESIYGKNILVLGVGDLGGTFAKKATALGASVIGLARTPRNLSGFSKVDVLSKLDEYLPWADIVLSALPSNEDTIYLFDTERFKKMKSSALFVNVGRGSLVKTAVLEEVAKEKIIGGMILDVFEKEPLPESSSLWDEEKVIVTPHISGDYSLPKSKDLFLEIVLDNLKALKEKKPFRNLVNGIQNK